MFTLALSFQQRSWTHPTELMIGDLVYLQNFLHVGNEVEIKDKDRLPNDDGHQAG